MKGKNTKIRKLKIANDFLMLSSYKQKKILFQAFKDPENMEKYLSKVKDYFNDDCIKKNKQRGVEIEPDEILTCKFANYLGKNITRFAPDVLENIISNIGENEIFDRYFLNPDYIEPVFIDLDERLKMYLISYLEKDNFKIIRFGNLIANFYPNFSDYSRKIILDIACRSPWLHIVCLVNTSFGNILAHSIAKNIEKYPIEIREEIFSFIENVRPGCEKFVNEIFNNFGYELANKDPETREKIISYLKLKDIYSSNAIYGMLENYKKITEDGWKEILKISAENREIADLVARFFEYNFYNLNNEKRKIVFENMKNNEFLENAIASGHKLYFPLRKAISKNIFEGELLQMAIIDDNFRDFFIKIFYIKMDEINDTEAEIILKLVRGKEEVLLELIRDFEALLFKRKGDYFIELSKVILEQIIKVGDYSYLMSMDLRIIPEEYLDLLFRRAEMNNDNAVDLGIAFGTQFYKLSKEMKEKAIYFAERNREFLYGFGSDEFMYDLHKLPKSMALRILDLARIDNGLANALGRDVKNYYNSLQKDIQECLMEMSQNNENFREGFLEIEEENIEEDLEEDDED